MNLAVEIRHTRESGLPGIVERASTTEEFDPLGGVAVVSETSDEGDKFVGAVSFGIPILPDNSDAEVRKVIIEFDCICETENTCPACEVTRFAIAAIIKQIKFTHNELVVSKLHATHPSLVKLVQDGTNIIDI